MSTTTTVTTSTIFPFYNMSNLLLPHSDILLPPQPPLASSHINTTTTTTTITTQWLTTTTTDSLLTQDAEQATALSLRQTRFAVQTVLTPIIVIIGLLGNILNILVLLQPSMRSSTNIYILVLSIADSTYLVFNFALSLLVCRKRGLSDSAYYFNPYGRFVSNFSGNIAVWVTVGFTVERYIAVCHPMRGKRWCTVSRAKLASVAIVLLCLVNTLPTIFELEVVETETGLRCQYTDFANQFSYEIVYSWWYVTVFTFIPLICLAIFNIVLIRVLLVANRKRQELVLISSSRKGSKDRVNKQSKRSNGTLTVSRVNGNNRGNIYTDNNDSPSSSLLNQNMNQQPGFKHTQLQGDSEQTFTRHATPPCQPCLTTVLKCQKQQQTHNNHQLKQHPTHISQSQINTSSSSRHDNNGSSLNSRHKNKKNTNHKISTYKGGDTIDVGAKGGESLGDRGGIVRGNGGGDGGSAHGSPKSSQDSHTGNSTIKRQGKRMSREQNKVTLLLVTIVMIFFLCQLPWTALFLYKTYLSNNSLKGNMTHVKIAGNICNLLGLINASGNFYLYSCFSQRFRNTFKSLCMFWSRKKSNMFTSVV